MSQPIFVQTIPSANPDNGAPQARDPTKGRNKSLYGMGIAEIVLGGLSMIFAILAMSVESRYGLEHTNTMDVAARRYGIRSVRDMMINSRISLTYSAPGLWGGLFIVITGVLAIRMKFRSTRTMHCVNLIMAIITANIAAAAFVISATILFTTAGHPAALTAIHALVALQTFASMVLTIVHAAFCCCGVCCIETLDLTRRVLYTEQYNVTDTPQQPQSMHVSDRQTFLGDQQQKVMRSSSSAAHESTNADTVYESPWEKTISPTAHTQVGPSSHLYNRVNTHFHQTGL